MIPRSVGNWIKNVFENELNAVLLCIGVSLMVHLPFMDMPPRGTHTWRQCNTLSVARNFYEEDMNILRPRIDRREDTDGVTGMQFPSYEFTVASVYHVFGEEDWVARIIQFIFFGFGIWGMYRLVLVLSENRLLAGITAWLYTWSPEMFYHGINALPDVLALSASIWGLYLFLSHLKTGGNLQLLGSLLLLILAGATKLQYLAVGGAMGMALLIRWSRNFSRGQLFKMIGFGITTIGMSLGWYAYARELQKENHLPDFGIAVQSFPSFSEVMEILRINLQMDIPESLLGFGTFAAFIFGAIFVFREKKWRTAGGTALLGWLLVLITYHILELKQMESHQYYMMPHIPIMIMLAGFGVLRLMNTKWRSVAILILIAAPVFAGIRIIPARWMDNPQVNKNLYDETIRNEIISYIPQGELAICGSDNSLGIYPYFLHIKGFAFNDQYSLTSEKRGQLFIENWIERGATVLVTDRSAEELDVSAYVHEELYHDNGFWIYRLKASSSSNQ